MVLRISAVIFCLSILTQNLISQETKGKCGIWRSFERLKQKKLGNQIDVITARPTKQKSIISPRGLFRIHYDTSIFAIPALVNNDGSRIENSFNQYADSVAKIFDEVYGIEIEQFGYPAPARDGIRGGGSEYDVYIENISDYGTTVPDDDTLILPIKINQQYPAYINIDNDYGIGYYTKGLDAVRVTAAHEFHHVIELSTTGYWSDDIYFYEMTATSLESTVYPNIRDYIQYIRTFYNNTKAWPLFLNNSGYERAIFLKMLIEKNGPGIINDIWTHMITERPIPSLQQTLQSYSTSLEKEFSEFSIWNYFTSSRYDSGKYYVDAKYFPPIKYYSENNASDSTKIIEASIKSFSLHYHKISHGIDSTFVIIANTNYDDAINELNQYFLYEYKFTMASNSSLPKLRPDLFAEFRPISSITLTNWKYSAITSEGIYVPPSPIIPSAITCYPNPFNPSDPLRNMLNFNFKFSSPPELYIFASSMNLIYSGTAQFSLDSGKVFAKWNGKDNKGNMVSSGIYFFYLNDQKTNFRGKFAVIR